jgi:hypothetical protein
MKREDMENRPDVTGRALLAGYSEVILSIQSQSGLCSVCKCGIADKVVGSVFALE